MKRLQGTEFEQAVIVCVVTGGLLAAGSRQLSWPVGVNYLGR
jgi:type IV secretory pathway VirB2 component (pilin)